MSGNLLFVKTIFLCKDDDIFCVFDNTEYIIVDPTNIKNIYEIYEHNSDSANIIIDSRLVTVIIYCIFKYAADIYVYNIATNIVENIFNWAKSQFKVSTSYFNIILLKKVLFAYVLSMYYLQNVKEKPFFSFNTVHNAIKNYPSTNVITLRYIVGFINVPCCTKNINEPLLKLISNIINMQNLENIIPFNSNTKIRDIQKCFAQLIDNKYVLNI